jgi:hypothetical protein
VIWVAAGITDALLYRKMVLEDHSRWNWLLKELIEEPVRFDFLVVRVQAPESMSVQASAELPTACL